MTIIYERYANSAAASLAGIAAAYTGAGPVTLVSSPAPIPVGALPPFTLNSGRQNDFLQGAPVILTSTTATSNAGVQVTVKGTDRMGQPCQETVTGPAGSTFVSTVRIFSSVSSITLSGAVTAMEAGWNGTDYTRWIFLGQRRVYAQYNIDAWIYGGVTAVTFDVQVTDMRMNDPRFSNPGMGFQTQPYELNGEWADEIFAINTTSPSTAKFQTVITAPFTAIRLALYGATGVSTLNPPGINAQMVLRVLPAGNS
jgi:hypothetical protein